MEQESQLFMQHIFVKVNQKRQLGFTLVEMLVVAPLIVLVIATLVGFLLGLVGDSVVANTRTQAVYDIQSALTQIERDSFLGTQFMSSYVPHSPQGEDGGVGAFSTSTGDIIINQFGTTSDPTDATRAVVYYANQPQACSGQYQANQPFFVKVVYFLKTETDGSKSLYRRMIVPLNNTGSNNGNTTCAAPWQRSSCTVQNLSDPRCQAKDIRLLTNVSSFTTTYFNKANPTQTITDPTIADSLRVTITVAKGVAGKAVNQTMSIASTRTNTVDPTPKAPGVPAVSVLNPTSTDYNNPILSTFQWTSSATNQYTYTYQINSGAWSTPVATTSTSVGVTMPYSYSTITFSVTATNDNGSSTGQYVYTTPLWTIPTLQNNWSNYGYGYAAAGYTKTSAGIIVLKGLVQRSGTPVSNEAIFTLPVGCRPSETSMFLAGGVGAADRLDIQTGGNVAYATGGAAFESLEGIAFIPSGGAPPSGVPYVWTALALQSNWVNYDPTWVSAGYTMDSLGRVFTKGLIKNGATADGSVIGTLPAGYQPPEYLHLPTTSDNVFDFTGFDSSNHMLAKGLALSGYRSIQHSFYANGYASWNALTLQNSWSWYGGIYATPQYTKGTDGIVKVKGLIHNGATASGTVVATLPPGYRPLEVSLQSAVCGSVYCRFDVQANGDIVTRDNVNAVWSALEGITFVAEQ